MVPEITLWFKWLWAATYGFTCWPFNLPNVIFFNMVPQVCTVEPIFQPVISWKLLVPQATRTVAWMNNSMTVDNDFTVAITPWLQVAVTMVTPLCLWMPSHTFITVLQIRLAYKQMLSYVSADTVMDVQASLPHFHPAVVSNRFQSTVNFSTHFWMSAWQSSTRHSLSSVGALLGRNITS